MTATIKIQLKHELDGWCGHQLLPFRTLDVFFGAIF